MVGHTDFTDGTDVLLEIPLNADALRGMVRRTRGLREKKGGGRGATAGLIF
jgi:hypothetical protein